MKLTLGNLVGHFFAKKGDNSYLADEKPISHVVGKNGNFAVRKNNLGTFIVKEDAIPNLEEVHEGVFLDVPKVPFTLFNHMVAWFKAVYEKDKTESTIMVFWNEEEGYKLWAPIQQNAGAASNYKRDDDPEYVEMCKKYELVMVNHSHPWGGTTVNPSGIDDKDEKEAMLYMVVGNVCGVPNVYVSTCPGGKRIKLNFFDIFENPLDNADIPKEYKALLAQYVPEKAIFQKFCTTEGYEIPAEWWLQHNKYVYVAPKTTYGGYGTGGKVTHINAPNIHDAEDAAAERRARSYYGAFSSDYGLEEDDFDPFYKKDSGYYGSGYTHIDDDMYPGSRVIVSDAFANEDDLDKYLKELDEEFEKDDINTLGDVIDATLELSDVKVAQLFYVLLEEGYGSLMKVCLEDQEMDVTRTSKKSKDKGRTRFAEDRLDAATKHQSVKGGKKNKDTVKTGNLLLTPSADSATGSGVKAGDAPVLDKPGIKLKVPGVPGLTIKE